MSLGLTKDHENPLCHPVCHPEFISGSQTMPGQEIPKQVRDDNSDGRKRDFRSKLFLNPQRSLPNISMPFLIRQYLFHHKPACRVTQFIKEFDVRLVLSNCLILSIKIVLHHLHKVAAFFNLRRGSSRVTAQIINPLCNHLHMFHLITPDLLKYLKYCRAVESFPCPVMM